MLPHRNGYQMVKISAKDKWNDSGILKGVLEENWMGVEEVAFIEPQDLQDRVRKGTTY